MYIEMHIYEHVEDMYSNQIILYRSELLGDETPSNS